MMPAGEVTSSIRVVAEKRFVKGPREQISRLNGKGIRLSALAEAVLPLSVSYSDTCCQTALTVVRYPVI